MHRLLARGSMRPAWWRGAELPDGGATVGFDDISEIVPPSAHGPGARSRAASHEIKNPLTPIQLSAERLEMKLSHCRLQNKAILAKSVKTIVGPGRCDEAPGQRVPDYAGCQRGRAAALPQCPADVCICTWRRNASVPVKADLNYRVSLASQAMRNSCARSCTTCCKTPRTPPMQASGRGQETEPFVQNLDPG